MYYNLIVHQTFLEPTLYNVDMEQDMELIQLSPVYEANQAQIDRYVELDGIFSAIFDQYCTVTKQWNEDKSEQCVQILCTYEDAQRFLQHADMPEFLTLRNTVGLNILHCLSVDYVSITETPQEQIQSLEHAKQLVGA